MRIFYKDEYETTLFDTESTAIPAVGNLVVFHSEDYTVKSIVWDIEYGYVNIYLSQSISDSKYTSASASNNTGRLAEMNNAIIQANKRQDVSEKRARALTEQVGGIRRHINQRIQQEKKDKP